MKPGLHHIAGWLVPVFLMWMLVVGFTVRADHATPVISCLEVHPDGSVTISWTNVDVDVQQQNVFYSADNGITYSRVGQLDTYNPDISNYHHLTADAGQAIRFYYVEIIYPDGTVESLPARTMLLFAQQPPLSGVVVLSWNDMQNNSNLYQIWQEVPVGQWSMIADDYDRTLYNDTLQDNICNDTVSYRVEVVDPAGCRSVSTVAGGRFSETRKPVPPIFDSISVNAAGEVVLGWTSSTSFDTRSTILYRNNFPIATIPVSAPFQGFLDIGLQPCTDPDLIYSLAAEDNCENLSIINDDSKLSPVFQHSPETFTCEQQTVLQWNPYLNANPPLEAYQVLYSVNGDPFTLAGTVDPSFTTFTHENILPATTYIYAIRAKFNGGSSTSCQKVITTGTYIAPEFIYLANASVLPSSQMEVTIDVDLAPLECRWEVWRSGSLSVTPVLIRTIDRGEITDVPLVFIDETAEVNMESYDYQVKVVDSCGRQDLGSNTMTTMLLTGEAISDEENHLQWNACEGMDAGIKQYRIFRSAGSTEALQPIDSVAPDVLEYTDHLAGQPIESGLAVYWIEAEENPGNVYGYRERSLSNRITFAQETGLYMPNAFRPGGLTPVFKPVFLFFNGKSYLFQIYNRWGQMIFETKQPDEGWDGTYMGNHSSTGTYLYRLVYQDYNGRTTEKRGAFTVVN